MTHDTNSAPIYSSLTVDPDLCDLVAEFVDAIPDRIEALLAAYESSDSDALGTRAHQLKGALGSYGFDDLSPVAARLEHSVRQHAPEEQIKTALDELVAQCRRMSSDSPS